MKRVMTLKERVKGVKIKVHFKSLTLFLWKILIISPRKGGRKRLAPLGLVVCI